MGASRDYTTGPDYGRSTALLERSPRVGAAPTRTPHRGFVPQRSSRGAELLRGNRLGSKQVVSFRGRQLRVAPKKNSLFTRLSAVALGLLIVGVMLSLWLSGLSTAQTFTVQRLTAQESMLDNQLETLNRDLENVRSASDIARRAHQAGMGIPVQPGIVEVEGNGELKHLREATPEQESVIDVNGEPVRPGQASTDPRATQDVSGNLNARPDATPGDAVRPEDSRPEAHRPPSPATAPGGAPAGQQSVELPHIPNSAPYAARG